MKLQQSCIYFILLPKYVANIIKIRENLFCFFKKSLLFYKKMWYNKRVKLYINYGG